MTEQSNPITESHPPDALLRFVNPMMKMLLRTPFAGPARNQLMVVDFTGRKSGKHYSIPLSAHVIDNILYAMTGATWKANFRDGADAQVLHDGKSVAMHGELITDKAHVVDLYARAAEGYGPKRAARAMGLAFRNNQMPSRDQFAQAVDELGLRAIRFTPAG
jgi:transposase InsO family protein